MTPPPETLLPEHSSARFDPPPPPARHIDRRRQLDRLDGVMTRALTTLTAPAGYGKTTLATDWVRERCRARCAWLRLDERDSDPEYLVSRAIGAVNHLAATSLSAHDRWLGDDGQRLEADAISRLAGAVSGCRESVLVVDGVRPSGPLALYADFGASLAAAEQCGLHLLVVGRCVPLPDLVPLQLSGVVEQVTAADLEVTPHEVAAIVAAHSGPAIDDATAAELAGRLGGWIAGAVLVAQARRNGEASALRLLNAAAAAFDGYFGAEVIDRVPDDVCSFLLQTSVIDELAPPLCDELTGRADSDSMLQGLWLRGLPIAPDHSAAGTYRCHPEFRAVLDARFRRSDAPARERALRSAASWYGEHGRPFEAAECYVELGDWDEVRNVVGLHIHQIAENDELSRLGDLIARMPPTVLRRHVEWVVAAAGVLALEGRAGASYVLLSVHRPTMTAAHLMVADVVRSLEVSTLDDPTAAVGAAERAIAAADELGDDYDGFTDLYGVATTDAYRTIARAAAAAGCAYAGWWERGRSHLVDVRPETAADLRPVPSIQLRGQRASFHVLAGAVGDGLAEAERALAIARDARLQDHGRAADAHLALGEGLRLAGEFDRAGEPLERASALARRDHQNNVAAAAVAAQAHLLVDTGDSEGALALLWRYHGETKHRSPAVLAGRLTAAEARAFAAMADYYTALKVLGHAAPTSTTRAVEVSVALAIGEQARARDALAEWPVEPTVASEVHRNLASAMVHEAGGVGKRATRSLRAGLALAVDHRLVQPVAEWGRPMTRLLRRIGRHERDSAIVKLSRRAEALITTGGATAPTFTPRESVVLARLDRGMTLPAIAAQDFVSVNTVKTQVRSIYRKLGVSSRADAIAAWRATTPPERG